MAPIGADTFSVTLYDAQDAGGNALSLGSTMATIVQGAANNVSLSFNGVIKSMALNSSPATVSPGSASTLSIIVTAKDAGGNTIIGAYSNPITLSNSDVSGDTTLSVNSVPSSNVPVIITYNGNAFSGATVTATATGAADGKLVIPGTNAGQCGRIISVTRGYYPCDLQSAYNLPSSTRGAGQTVAIVDAYDDPNAESDLGVYRSTFGLPSCTSANGCFKKINQSGATLYPRPDRGWSQEISIDLDMVSAICPNCHILLVEAQSDAFSDLDAAENEAANLGANEISNSYGGPEDPMQTIDDPSYNHPGIVITVSGGDDGFSAGASFPATSPYVTSVGGTTLTVASNSRGWSETAWTGTGSGCSVYEPKPAWQVDGSCAFRMTNDLAALGDPATGVAIYDSYVASGWLRFGGTSVSAPIIAGVYALSGNASSVAYAASYPYSHINGLHDIVSGSNGACVVSYFCNARSGYDGPTGLGSPDGVAGLTSFAQLRTSSIVAGHSLTPDQQERGRYDPGPTTHACPRAQPHRATCFAVRRTDVGSASP